MVCRGAVEYVNASGKVRKSSVYYSSKRIWVLFLGYYSFAKVKLCAKINSMQ